MLLARVISVLLVILVAYPTSAQDYRVYRGCLHIHSTYSDGGGTISQIVEAAQKVGLDYAILTDHNTLKPLQDGHEGWHGNTLLLIGTELSLPAGHYLALNVPRDFVWDSSNTQRAINQVNAVGGFGLLAHPISRWRWKDWNVIGYTGMELTNLSSLFHQEGTSQPLRLLTDFVRDYLSDSQRAMRRVMSTASDGSLERWAAILKQRQTVGLGGVDAHALIWVGRNVFHIPQYSEIFQALQVHVLVPEAFNGDLEHDKRLVYSALQNGRCYTAYTVWGDPTGFQFTATRGEATAVMGQPISREGGTVTLRVRVPSGLTTTTRIYLGDRRIFSTTLKNVTIPAPVSGAYRAEVDIRREGRMVPWIISNPIYVR